jgi:hypothetical protein
MKKVVGIAALFLMAVVGCKNDKSTDKPVDVPAAAAEKISYDHFRVEVDVVATKDDTFSVFYTTNGTIDFNANEVIWYPVKGSANEQHLYADLPKDIIPSHLRLDFGLTKQDVVFKKITILYHDKQFVAAGPDIFKYFAVNPAGCTADPATGTLKVLPIKESGISLYPLEPLTAELNTLTL